MVSGGRVQSEGPLISTPELFQHSLGLADEVLILASDGLWDVVTSQAAVAYARRHLLQPCATPKTCAAALVRLTSPLNNVSGCLFLLAETSLSQLSAMPGGTCCSPVLHSKVT